LNLTTRFATKQNTLVSGTDIKTINSNNLLGSGNISVGTLVGADTVSLSNRINTKLNPTDTVSLSNRINLKLNPVDTISLSNRINAKGTGTVTSIATGYGLNGGTITITGTLLLDSAVVFTRIRDSIVDVAIGNDTIKILKQEYAPVLTSVLTWTVTPKFPIQLKAYILVFRNGQLLNNDQYNLTDTNKITIVSTSFKIGANYTVATVSGIGSVGTGVFPNPVYPEAGIALSTGSAWASSIPNNSSNWNIAYNDKINNAAFTGTDTKTLTLTQLDGGTITAPFTDLQGIVAGDTSSMLLPYLRRADTTAMLLPYFRDADTTSLNLTSRFNTKVNLSDTLNMLAPYLRKADTTNMLLPYFRDADTTSLNLTNRFAAKLNISDTLNMLSKYLRRADTTLMLLPYLRRVDTTLMLTPYLRKADTTSMLLPYFRDADTSLLNLTSRFATKQNILNGTGFVKASGTNITYDNSSYLRTGLADSSYLKLTGGTLTGDLYAKYLNTFAKTTYIPFDVGIGENLTNISSAFRGGTIMVFPDSSLIGSSANVFLANKLFADEYSTFGSGMRNYAHQGGDVKYNSLALYTSGSGSKNTNRLYINYNGDIGINDDTPSYTLDVNGTLGVTSAATLSSTLAVTGDITEAGNNVLTNLDTVSLSNRIDTKYNSSGGTISGSVTLSTTSATPSTLLGKDGSNVVGTVTTVAQTGLMTRDIVTDASTISGSELINVTHGFTTEPTAVLLTVFGNTSYILQVASKNTSTFTVQVKNYDGTPAINATLISFSWLAIK
jgi:hypothetical protein